MSCHLLQAGLREPPGWRRPLCPAAQSSSRSTPSPGPAACCPGKGVSPLFRPRQPLSPSRRGPLPPHAARALPQQLPGLPPTSRPCELCLSPLCALGLNASRDSLFPLHRNHLDVCVVPSDFSSTPSLLPRQELRASPPTLPAREGTAAPAERSAQPHGAPLQPRGQQEQEGSICVELPAPPWPGRRAAVPLRAPTPSPPLHTPGDRRGLSSLRACRLHRP